MLDVEHDCSEVFASVGCIPQEVCKMKRHNLHPSMWGGLVPPCGGPGKLIPPGWGVRGLAVPRWGFGGSAPQAKNRCKIAL